MFGSMFVLYFWHYQIAEFNISDPFLGSVPVSFHSFVPSSFYFRAPFCDLNLAKRFKATTLVRFVLAIFKWMNVSVDSFKKGIRKRMSANMMLQYQFLNCFWQGSNLWPNGFDDCLVKSYFYLRLPFMRILLMAT